MEFEPFGVGATTSAGILFQGESKGWERDSRLEKQLEILLAPHSVFSLPSGATGISPRPGGKKCSWARVKWDLCPGAVDAMTLHIYCITHIFVPIFSAGPWEICTVAFPMATGSLCSHLGSSLSHLLFLVLKLPHKNADNGLRGPFSPGFQKVFFSGSGQRCKHRPEPPLPPCLDSSL